ncbi:alpha/beta fold hydrolase [Stigmatella sp. ncwal1]|uniref:Alpha/beta fold hydrolase n=1 Tax=Stigmatella ashevillensis TaxID=2995309 RepID=A0ABT5DDV0_9BACT|nr:alpha/beta fold hydrolase [Stigmatella ashevillena]MDC0710958.1 alpha/beta fold hydrolase [Stigmatella ashevillena]
MSSLSTLSLPLPSLRMQALQAGPSNGPLVLLLHGFPESSESWREVLPVLGEAGFRAVAPDLRGYGGTDRPKSGYDIDTLARDIQQLARYLQPDRAAHVVGHDWGGAIAFHLAAWHPQTVDRLVAVNAPHMEVMVRNLRNPAQLLRSSYMLYFQLPWLPERRLSKNGGAAVARLIRRALVNPARVPEERLARYAENFSRPEAVSAALAYYRHALRGLLLQRGPRRSPRIRAPFRLIWGKEDAALGIELTQGLEPWFEHPPEVRYLPGVGHFAPLEAPEQVAALILEHLTVSPGAAAPR